MPTPSPLCTVNGVVPPLDVAAGSTVTIALAMTSGAQYWAIACTSTDETTTPAAVNATLVINGSAKTATFTAPGAGTACIFSSTVGVFGVGRDINNQTQPAFTSTFKINVPSGNGNRVLALNETLEQGMAGWLHVLNKTQRAVSADVSWFGAVGDGVTDNSAAFAAAIASGIRRLRFSPGTYSLNTSTTFPLSITLEFIDGAVIAPTLNPNGAKLTINGPILAAHTQQIFSGVSQTWQITQSGAGPVVNLDRSSSGLWADTFRIKIVGGGDLWNGDTAPTFQYSLDGGTTYLPVTPVTIPQATNGQDGIPAPYFYTVPGTGIRVMFPPFLYALPVTLSENLTPVRLTVASTASFPTTTPRVAVSATMGNVASGAYAVGAVTGTTFTLTGSSPTGGTYPGYGGEVSVPATYVASTVYSWTKTSGALTTSQSGTSPGITVTNPNTTGVCYGFQIRIILGGVLGTDPVSFSFTPNNGFAWSPVYACPAAGVPFVLPSTAMTVAFAAGTYHAGATYGFTTLSPQIILTHGKDSVVSTGWWGIDPTGGADCTASVHAAVASCGHYEATGGENGAINVLTVRTPHGKYLTTGIYLCDAFCNFEGAGHASGWGGDAQDYISYGTQFVSTTNFPILTFTSNGFQLGLGRASPIPSLRFRDFAVQGNNASITVYTNAASAVTAVATSTPMVLTVPSTSALGINQIGQVISVAPAYVGITLGTNTNVVGCFTVSALTATTITLQNTTPTLVLGSPGTYIAGSCHVSPFGWQHGIVLDSEAPIIAHSVHAANTGGYGIYIAESVGSRFYDALVESSQLDCIAMDNGVAPPLCKSVSTYPAPRGITCNYFFGGAVTTSAVGSGFLVFGGSDGSLVQGFISQSHAQYAINIAYDFNALKRPVTGQNAKYNNFTSVWDEANLLGGWIFGGGSKFNQINWSQNSDKDKGPNGFSDGSTLAVGASNQVTGANLVQASEDLCCNQTQIASLVRPRVQRSVAAGPYTLQFNPSPSWAELLLAGNVTAFTFDRTGILDGQILDVMLVQPATAAYTVAWAPQAGPNLAFLGGLPPVITPTPGARDKHAFYYDRQLDTFFETSRSQNIHGFDLNSIANCTMWLRADRGVTLNGSTVSAWASQVGSFTAMQATAAKQPTFTASDAAMNHQASIVFDGSTTWLDLGAVDIWGAGQLAVSLVVIVKSTGVAIQRGIICKEYNADSWFFGNDFRASTGKWCFFAKDSSSTGEALTASSHDANPHCLVATYQSGGNTYIWQDNSVSATTGTATGAVPTSADHVGIGASSPDGSTAGYFQDGHVVEIAAYNRVLTAAEIATIRIYSQTRYGTP